MWNNKEVIIFFCSLYCWVRKCPSSGIGCCCSQEVFSITPTEQRASFCFRRSFSFYIFPITDRHILQLIKMHTDAFFKERSGLGIACPRSVGNGDGLLNQILRLCRGVDIFLLAGNEGSAYKERKRYNSFRFHSFVLLKMNLNHWCCQKRFSRLCSTGHLIARSPVLCSGQSYPPWGGHKILWFP